MGTVPHCFTVTAMQIRVLFFGLLKDLAGHSWDLLTLPDEATAGDVLEHYETRMPSLKGKLSSIAVSVNQEYCGPEAKLHSGDEVALLPPVSGGSARAAIVRERIDTAAELEKVKQPAITAVDGGLYFSNTKHMKRWRGSKWNRWRSRH